MTRAFVISLALIAPIGPIVTQGHEATRQDWAEFFDAVGQLNATIAGADAAMMPNGNGWRQDECRYQSLNRPIWTAKEERLTARCAVNKFLPGRLAQFLAIGQCESGWSRLAYNSGGAGYVGIFQHSIGAYVSRIHEYEPAAWKYPLSTNWRNSRGQIVMSARMMHAVGTSPWSCA